MDLKKTFNWAVKGLGLVALTEVIIFTLVHANTGGMFLMSTITPPLNSVFDATGVTSLMYTLGEAFGGSLPEMANNLGGTLAPNPDGGTMFIPGLTG